MKKYIMTAPGLVASLALNSTAMAVDCDINSGLSGGINCTATQQQKDKSDFAPQFQKITNTLLFIIGALSVIMIVYGGLRFVLSQGEEKGVTSARNTIIYALIGLIVAILAYALVNFVLKNFL